MGSNITWSLIELSRHPESLAKLMAEIKSVDTIDFKTINSRMPYLDAVFMEINRLYPVVHATVRVINRETTLASSKKPVIMKPGMLIYLSYLHLQTSPEFWGPDAREFVPERFLGGYNKDQPFMSFGYGPRNCVSLPDCPDEKKREEIDIARSDTNSPSWLPRRILGRYCKRTEWTSGTTTTR